LLRVATLLRQERERTGRDLLVQNSQWRPECFVLPPVDLTEGKQLCECCHKQPATPAPSNGTIAAICPACQAERTLGRLLPAARYLACYTDDQGRHQAPLGSFELCETPPPTRPQLLLDLDCRPDQDASSLPLFGAFRSRHIPRHPQTGEVIELADLAGRSIGWEALGCLKMDVDNLGFIFTQGLKTPSKPDSDESHENQRDRTSISRVATLSRALELFFAGYLEQLLRQEFSDIYLIYAGGDDLAAIGPWNRTFDLALRICQEFRRFTAENPAWSISAGLAVVHPHVPVLVALEHAEKLLKASKTIRGEGVQPWPQTPQSSGPVTKGRLTAFGTSIPWDQLSETLQQAQRLIEWLQQGVLSAAQVRRVLHLAQMAQDFQRTGKTIYLEYLPLLARELRRNWQQPCQREALEWARRLMQPEAKEMKIARFVCHYALYGVRTTNQED